MKKIILSSTFLFAFMPFWASAHGLDLTGDYDMMPWGGMMGFGGLWFWIMALTSIVWLVAGILVIIWLWRRLNK